MTYGDVVVRVNPNYRLAMHIDTDGQCRQHQHRHAGFIEDIQSGADSYSGLVCGRCRLGLGLEDVRVVDPFAEGFPSRARREGARRSA